MKSVALRDWVFALVVLLAVSGMLCGLLSYFLPWYDVYYYISYRPTVVVYPWYVTGASPRYFGPWPFYDGFRGLCPRGILLGSLIGLAAMGGLVYRSFRLGVYLFRDVACLIVLLLPWIGTTSLYVLWGYETGVPGPPAIPEASSVPVLARGFYTNLLASVLLLLALGACVATGHFEEESSPLTVRRMLSRVPLLALAAIMASSGYLPWYVNVPNRYAPEFLLPLTLGISLSSAVVYTLEYEENTIVPLLVLAGGLILLFRPQDPNVLLHLYEYGVPPALIVFQVSALFWVVVGLLWLSQLTRPSKARRQAR